MTRDYRADNRFHFSADSFALFYGCTTLYIKAGIEYNGTRKSRIVAKIVWDTESRAYTIDKSYPVNVVYRPISYQEDPRDPACFGKQVFAIQEGNRFMFVNRFRQEEPLQYDWYVCDADKNPLYHTNYRDDCVFTTTLEQEGTYYIQAIIREAATNKTYAAFLYKLESDPDSKQFTLHPFYGIQPQNSKCTVCFSTAEYSVQQKPDCFTFRNNKAVKGQQYAYQLLDADGKKAGETAFSADSVYSFTVPDCKLPLLVRGIVQYNGFISARILSEINKQPDGSYTLDDRYRIKRLPTGQAEKTK